MPLPNNNLDIGPNDSAEKQRRLFYHDQIVASGLFPPELVNLKNVDVEKVYWRLVNEGLIPVAIPTRTSLGIDNVNNTSDVDKPVSALQQAALNTKLTRVTTRAQLEAAIAVGGTIFVDETVTIAITGSPILINTGIPTKIVGGHFTLDGVVANGNPAYGFWVTQSNVTFDGCRFTGPGTGGTYSTTSPLRFIYVAGVSDTNRLTNVNVRNCRMDGSAGDNIYYRWVTDSFIIGNDIDNFLYSGIMILTGESIVIANNVVQNGIMKAPVVNVYGVAITDSSNTEVGRSRNVMVTGNRIHNIAWEGIDTHGGDNITITGNIVTDCQRGIALVVGNDTRIAAPTNCVVTGNIVRTTTGSTREGICLFGNAALDIKADATITGNDIEGYYVVNNLKADAYTPAKTFIGNNNVPFIPWKNLTLQNNWVGNSPYPAQYMVDGHTVYFRGSPFAPTTRASAQTVAQLAEPEIRPTVGIQFYSSIKGNNAAAGFMNWGVTSAGALTSYYSSTTDQYSYQIDGSYKFV